MPIYEYECINCGNKFELLRSSRDDKKDLKCPKCKSAEIQKVLSVVSSGTGNISPSCGKSGSGFS